MESYALALSPLSTQFLRSPQLKKQSCRFTSGFRPERSVLCWRLSSSFNDLTAVPLFLANTKSHAHIHLQFKASSVPENADGFKAEKPSEFIQTLQLAAMFATWYLLNIYYNILNKQVHLRVYILHYSFNYGGLLRITDGILVAHRF